MSDTNAIFTYGTLRADYRSNGDAWGVFSDVKYSYKYGKLYGYSLYQNEILSYPFITPSTNSDDFVIGTFIWFPDNPERFNEKLRECDRIEGFDSMYPTQCLYDRKILDIEYLDDKYRKNISSAYVYYQEYPKDVLKTYKYFPEGDWLQRPSSELQYLV